MVEIELIDKIIKIPANKETLVVHDSNPEDFFIKIPKKLLTTKIENSSVFLLSQLNENESSIELLELFFDDDEYAMYKWTIRNNYTYQEGKLTIQIKIVRNKSDETEEEIEDIDTSMLVPIGNDSEEVWYSYQNSFKITKVLNVLL